MELYRFRNIYSLLDKHNELENQEIFFASPSSLNDPMEGYRDIVWTGDDVVWRNLFKNFLYGIFHAFDYWVIGNDSNFVLTRENIKIAVDVENITPKESQDLFLKILSDFYRIDRVTEILKLFSEHRKAIHRDELIFYLRSIFYVGLRLIALCYDKKSGNGSDFSSEAAAYDVFSLLEFKGVDYSDHDVTEQVLATNNSFEQSSVIRIAELPGTYDNKGQIEIDGFVKSYVSKLEEIVFPDWYTACFMKCYTNSAVWGHYADSHRGVCLIFDSVEDEDGNYLELRKVAGISSKGKFHKLTKMKFYAINYIDGVAELDYFRKLGKWSLDEVASMWLTHDGVRSECADKLFDNESVWRGEYWESFYQDVVKKTKDWDYEKEFRLLLTSGMDISKVEDRRLKYDFMNLKGIIFGINTSSLDKARCVNILKEKCRAHNRKEFLIYQAYYDAKSRVICKVLLDRLSNYVVV